MKKHGHIPKTLEHTIKFGFQVEMLGSHFTNTLRAYLALTEGAAEEFKRQFRRAILQRSITPEQYATLTGDTRFPTPDTLDYWLRDVWSRLYHDEPITSPE